MVFIIGRSVLLGEGLQDSRGKRKQSRRKGPRAEPGVGRVGCKEDLGAGGASWKQALPPCVMRISAHSNESDDLPRAPSTLLPNRLKCPWSALTT